MIDKLPSYLIDALKRYCNERTCKECVFSSFGGCYEAFDSYLLEQTNCVEAIKEPNKDV